MPLTPHVIDTKKKSLQCHLVAFKELAKISMAFRELTPMPTTQQGPMTRARARELNYQVNLFLAVHKPSSQNWMLLNYCDDFIVIRNDGEESNGSTNLFGHQDCTTRKHKIEHQVHTSSSCGQAITNWFGNISRLRMLFEAYEYSLERSWSLLSNGSNPTTKFHRRRSVSTRRCSDL